MATAPKRLDLRSWASDRELIELAKTMDLEAIAKKIGRKPEAILKRAKRLGIKIEMVDAR
jgi:ribosomal protein L32E